MPEGCSDDAAEHHEDATVRRFVVHGVRALLVGHFIQLRHAGDVTKAAEGYGFQPVLSVSLAEAKERRAKADEVAPHPHAGHTGGDKVPCLVQGDGKGNA